MTLRRIGAGLVWATMLVWTVAAQNAGQQDKQFQSALQKEMVAGDLKAAIEGYHAITTRPGVSRALAAEALLRMAECYQKLGDAQARAIYERLVREFADQPRALSEAKARLASLHAPAREKAATHGVSARQVWTGTEVDNSGSVSPDGRLLSFTFWETGDLALRDLSAGTMRRLTNTGGWEVSGNYVQDSVISPDGRQIAYGWFVQANNTNELRILPVSATENARARVILSTERSDYHTPFGWSPDGGQVFILRSLPDHTSQIGVVSLQTGAYRNIKSLEWRSPTYRGIALSRDGRYIAYDTPAADNGSPRDIRVLAVDGSSETVAAQGPGDDVAPQWSPDGSRLVFVSNRTGSYGLWSVPLENGKAAGAPLLAKPDIGLLVPLGITRDGGLHYTVSGTVARNIYCADLTATGASEPVVAAEQFLNSNTGPSWSSDGEAIAYYSFRAAAPVLVIKSMSSEKEQEIPLPPTVVAPFNLGPKWFPDGRSFLVLQREAQAPGFAFARVYVDGAKIEPLYHVRDYVSSYALSPDGNAFFYAVQKVDGKSMSGRLSRVDIPSKREFVLNRDGWFIALSLSPDGKQLAYVESTEAPPFDSMIRMVPARGGEVREVFRVPKWRDGSRYNTLAWTPDQQFLLFVRQSAPKGPNVLWKVPASGGEPEKVGLSMSKLIKSPAVRPDGRQIVFGTTDTANWAVWTIEHFLPAAPDSHQ
jgi:Tol biopolymer transport system component